MSNPLARLAPLVPLTLPLAVALLATCAHGDRPSARAGASEAIRVVETRVEYLDNPVGIDTTHPRLSWVLSSSMRGQTQAAYQILVASSAELLAREQGDLWDSGKVSSSEQTLIPYGGRALRSRERAFFRVRAWNAEGTSSDWSETGHWEMGLLAPADWKAKWIGMAAPAATKANDDGQAADAPAPMLRRSFKLDSKPDEARVYLSGLGYYDLYINGRRVGDQVLDPAFTAFDRRVQYVTHDVTDFLVAGENTVGVILGGGFFRTYAADFWEFDKAPWRATPRLRLQLEAQTPAGHVQTIVSDESWQIGAGPIVFQGIRNGETYDARRANPDWARAPGAPGAAGAPENWQPAALVDAPKGQIVARMHPPIRVTETLRPLTVSEPAPGVHVFDLGQNIAGWARLHVSGPAGTRVQLKYGEQLNGRGRLQKSMDHVVRPGPFQTDTYILRGDGIETWEPRFTYHGFQYVEVTGLPTPPTLDTLEGRVVHTDFASAGTFESSHPLLDRIQEITRWSYRGNFHGLPTDCPHREKNGWTGDAHLAVETGMWNFANAAAYHKWVDDLLDAQGKEGNLPGIVPSPGWGFDKWSGPSWEAALFEIPWALYRFHGDRDVLAKVYPAWIRYLDYLEKKAEGDLMNIGLGDWVPFHTITPVIITSSGYYFRFADLTARVAAMLGHDRESERYGKLAQRIQKAFRERFVLGHEGGVADNQDTALATALYHGILLPDEHAAVVKRLADQVVGRKFHLDTGVIGAKYALRALVNSGYTDVAYRVASATNVPSLGHWVINGATTLWEAWAGEGSHNHIFFGDISAWFYEVLAGIRPDDDGPGFARIMIRPHLPDDLNFVKASHMSPRGLIKSEWKRESGGVRFQIEIPVNTRATVTLPAASPAQVREGDGPAAEAPGVTLLENAAQPGTVDFLVGSGRYDFFVAR